jgi:hypothetical protein
LWYKVFSIPLTLPVAEGGDGPFMVLGDRYSDNYWALGALPLGVALDLIVGDPRGWPHPVRGVGRLIGVAERGLRVAVVQLGGSPRVERLAGVVLTTVVVGLVASLAWLLTDLCDQVGGPVLLIGRGLMIYWGLAIRSLAKETLRASEAPSLFEARRELAMIGGRDTARLDATEINRACVETIGEKTNDAIVAPLFWLALLGPAGLWGYKALSMLDSMVRSKNARSLAGGRTVEPQDWLERWPEASQPECRLGRGRARRGARGPARRLGQLWRRPHLQAAPGRLDRADRSSDCPPGRPDHDRRGAPRGVSLAGGERPSL